MWRRLTGAWRAASERRALSRRVIPDADWRRTLKRFPFLALPAAQDAAELRRLTSLFLDRKEFSGAAGLVLTDDIAVAIAAQACLPVLRLGLAPYAGFIGIVVHPGQVRARREITDEDGIVHDYEETLSGEAMQGGPVMLSWQDVRRAGRSAAQGYNVVIHEFAHVLDLGDGEADGVPPLPADQREPWRRVLMHEYDSFCRRVDAGDDTALDPYGAEDPGEFFAVASEAFFVAPAALLAEHPALYRLLAGYYRQNPACA
jgi:Mlc titration factor MtfA (ptsG expression regulator)